MQTPPKESSDLTEIELKIDNLKISRTGIERQLREAQGRTVSAEETDEGLVERFLGKLYRGGPPPRSTKPSREALQAEADALNESLTRLRSIRKEVKLREDAEETRRLKPAYLVAIAELEKAIEAAVQANEAVIAIERQIPTPLAHSKAWNALSPLGMAHAISLKDWQKRVKGFLDSQYAQS
ncbi:MAG: hypothetical protein H0X47_09185 [Nitrospirales bacterium]|nr:hypothetical protein [Nitrospirales bacterium]